MDRQANFTVEIPAAAEVAARLGISTEAVELTRASDVIDLHIDTFIPPRLYRYDLFKRHGHGFLGGRLFGHLDFHRALEAGLTGAMWSITTNPFRRARSRWRVFRKNLTHFRAIITRAAGRFRVVRTRGEYDEARKAGLHAVMLSIQGGNALQAAPEGVASIPDDVVTRVTLVHLTNSCYGITSSPLRMFRSRGLTDAGRDLVQQLNARRVFVDLAHIHPTGFWDAVEVHDKTQPLIATHTGVNGVKKHWRNLSDDQIKAIADTGGVVGVIFATNFLRPRGGPRDCQMILDHVQHVIDVAGDDHAALGSDYDGFIVPPRDLRDGAHYPRLVQGMLDRGWSVERIQKVLGLSYLRSFALLRP